MQLGNDKKAEQKGNNDNVDRSKNKCISYFSSTNMMQ